MLTRSNTYRFLELDLSAVYPFGKDCVLNFMDGVNIVGVTSSHNKSIVMAALQGRVAEAQLKVTDSLDDFLPSWLIYFDEDTCFARRLEEQLATFLTSAIGLTLDRQRLEKDITLALRQLLATKVISLSKFSNTIQSSQDIDFKLTSDADFQFTDNRSSRDLNSYFQAHGERVVLYLAVISAIHIQLRERMSVPFVAGHILGLLDSGLREAVSQFVGQISEQVIIFEDRDVIEQLELHATNQLVERVAMNTYPHSDKKKWH